MKNMLYHSSEQEISSFQQTETRGRVTNPEIERQQVAEFVTVKTHETVCSQKWLKFFGFSH